MTAPTTAVPVLVSLPAPPYRTGRLAWFPLQYAGAAPARPRFLPVRRPTVFRVHVLDSPTGTGRAVLRCVGELWLDRRTGRWTAYRYGWGVPAAGRWASPQEAAEAVGWRVTAG